MKKIVSKTSIIVLAFWSQAQTAIAQGAEGLSRGDYYHGPGMMWGGFGGFGMFFGFVFMILLLLLIVIGIVFLLRAFGGGLLATSPNHQSDTSLNILKERYARGELDTKEFNERKQQLSD